MLLLAALQAGLVFLGSSRGVRLLAAPDPVANLDSLAAETQLGADGSLSLAATKPQTIARLGGFAPAAGQRHLIHVRANAGLPFDIQMIDTAENRATRTWQIPARGETGTHLLAIEPWALAPANRLEIRNPSPDDLTVYALDVLRLRPAHAALTRSAVPLALALLAMYGWRHRRALAAYLGAGARPAALDGVTCGLFFLLCLHVFLDAPVNQVLDSKWSTVVSHQLLRHGDVSLPDDFAPALSDPLPYQLQSVSDRFYHFYPDAVALLNAPLVAVFEWLGLSPIGANGLFLRHHELAILVFAAALQAAALCALLLLLGRLYLPPLPTLTLTGLFAFGTQIFSSVSRAYWTHAWGGILLVAALYLLLAPATRDRRWAYVAAATCLSWSFFCRPPIAVAILAVTVYLAVSRRRHLVAFAGTGAVWAALFAAYSLHNFGEPIPPYFLTKHLETGVLGAETLRRSYFTAVVGNLVSASRGLFVFVPFLLLPPWLTLRHWGRLPDRALALTGLLVCVAHWQLLSANKWWWGGQSYGPRLFSDVLVWFFLLAAMALPHEARLLRRQPRGVVAAKGAVALLLAAMALFINIRGANSRATFTWNGSSYFDWSDPQFLAGLLPRPEPPTLAERLLALREEPDSIARAALLTAILRDENVPKRTIETGRSWAAFVTWDAWTYGDAPAAVIVFNDGSETLAPRLGLATWADASVYPITVAIEDGVQTTSHVLSSRGRVEVELSPIPPGWRRLYLVWSDRAWTPGESDPRDLGVKLLAPR